MTPEQKAEQRKAEITLARKLRDSDPRAWTQKRLARTFGVVQSVVSDWLKSTIIPIIGSDNGNNPPADDSKPDARVTIPKSEQHERRGKAIHSFPFHPDASRPIASHPCPVLPPLASKGNIATREVKQQCR